MCDEKRQRSNDAVEKIIGNMTAEMQNKDGQYVPLGFTPPATSSDSLNWSPSSNPFVNPYNIPFPEAHLGHSSIDHYQQTPINFVPQSSQLFESPMYKRNMDCDLYKTLPNGTPESLYNRDYNYVTQGIMSDNRVDDTLSHTSTHTQLIENLVGNWAVPNNSGTYSPFGNPEAFKPTVFDRKNSTETANTIINQNIDETRYNDHVSDEKQFNFNRDVKKPRMVAEVKPMRPSYSDVLTKPVPPTSTKPVKADVKEQKTKKESKKNAKSDKSQKVSNSLNRSNTTNEIKDIPLDKNTHSVKTDKKNIRNSQLNRKWASLDNISEPHVSKSDSDPKTKKKSEENTFNKSNPKNHKNKQNKPVNEPVVVENENVKNETFNITKNNTKKNNKSNNLRQKQNDSFGNDRPPGKRNQRGKKKENTVPFGIAREKIKQCIKGWWRIFAVFVMWLFHLISDVCSLSIHISHDVAANSWSWLCLNSHLLFDSTLVQLKKVRLFTWIWEKFKGRRKTMSDEDRHNFAHNGLDNNIVMPTTGDEAMKRLLACKGKDPYSILGVTPTCTDDDIKRYYKRQAVLVHPDKNNQPGAEEAFKILVHAFDMIGTPERRASYDRGVAESAQVVQAWSELTELLQQLQQKVEAAATTIRCSACGQRHKRSKVDRPCYAARWCTTCKIRHSAREGDIWAEATRLGFVWRYYACMEGSVYDVTAWAACQRDGLRHLRPDAHHVQYRIALGKQNNQPHRNSTSSRNDRPDLENILNSLYGQNENNSRRRNKGKK